MSRLGLQSTLILALLSLCAPPRAGADALVRTYAMRATTIAEYFIEDDRITVVLEIGDSDLPAFRNLMPDDIYTRITGESRPYIDRLRTFFTEDFPIAAPGAPPIMGQILEMEPRPRILRDDITGEPIAAKDSEPDLIVFARIEYPLTARPDEVAFSAPPGTSVGFVAYHRGVAVNDFRYLSKRTVLTLDPVDPFYSRFQSRTMRRQYFSPMSGFIYVEPYEVRKEIIFRPVDLQQWVDLGLEGRESIPVDLQAEVERRSAEFLRGRMAVMIDGEAIAPELARIHFLERTLRTSRVIDPPRELDVYSAVIGVIFVYPTDGLPERVTMEWDLWSDRLDRVPVSAVDQAGALPSFLERDFAVLEWQNFLKNPVLPTLVVVVAPPTAVAAAALWLRWLLLGLAIASLLWVWRGAGARRPRALTAGALALLSAAAFWMSRDASVDEARGRDVVAALLHNVYRAFDYRDEERIYDVLARSATGDLLEQIYLETRRGLVLASQGGARAKVKEIAIERLSAEPADGGAFVADVTWIVGGSVGHWGHVHQRKNQVRAELTISPRDGAWKLAKMDVLEEERL